MNRVKIIRCKLVPTIMTSVRSIFVQNARSLEKLKTSGVPEDVFKNGKYIVFDKDTCCVLIDPSMKTLVWKNNEQLTQNTDHPVLKVVLDVVGQNSETCLFAVELPISDLEKEASDLGGKFYDPRKALFILNDKESSLVSHVGESMEGNIRREIAEEVGLDVAQIEYTASQHWAMPDSQLMLGCIATATTEDLELDPVELEAGQWVDATTLCDAVSRAKSTSIISNPSMLWVPPPTAVAHSLMESWLRKYHGYLENPTSHI